MRPAVAVALATAASLFGDTLLYTALPVNAARLGLSPLVVGLLATYGTWTDAGAAIGALAGGSLAFVGTGPSLALGALAAALTLPLWLVATRAPSLAVAR